MTILRFDHSLKISETLFRKTTLRRCRLEECGAACFRQGVRVDPLEKDDILRHSRAILPHLPEGRRDPKEWFGDKQEPNPALPSGYVVPTVVIANPGNYRGTECVFLRPDRLCSLQTAAVAAGEHPWRWKPFHCIIHPISTEGGEFVLAPDEELLAEEGSCFRGGARATRMNDWLAEEIDLLAAGDRGRSKEKFLGD